MSKNARVAIATIVEPSIIEATFGKIDKVSDEGVWIFKARPSSSKTNRTLIPHADITSIVRGGASNKSPDAVYHKGMRKLTIEGVFVETDKRGYAVLETANGKAYVRTGTLIEKEAGDAPESGEKKKKKKKAK